MAHRKLAFQIFGFAFGTSVAGSYFSVEYIQKMTHNEEILLDLFEACLEG